MILPEELEAVEFFINLGPAHANQIASLAQAREFPPGGVIFREGDECQFVNFVLRGAVRLEIAMPAARHPLAIQTVGPGELLGWSPFLGSKTMTATAIARKPTRLASIRAEHLTNACREDPTLGMAFLRELALVLTDRLRATRKRLARR